MLIGWFQHIFIPIFIIYFTPSNQSTIAICDLIFKQPYLKYYLKEENIMSKVLQKLKILTRLPNTNIEKSSIVLVKYSRLVSKYKLIQFFYCVVTKL